MKLLNVTSEIGLLKKVLLHRPGKELENLTPKWLDQLLFDDIPWLDLAQKEHDAFANILRENNIEVLYLVDLVTETLDYNETIKEQFINQFIEEAHITSETLSKMLSIYLHDFKETKDMVEATMAGIKKTDLPNFVKRTLTDYIRDYPFVTDPMPNLYFTRDPFSILENGVCVNKMHTQARDRETIYGEYIFKYHPLYQNEVIPHFYDRHFMPSIEGGDILILSESILAVGVSERTHPAAIEKLAKNLFFYHQTTFDTILAFDIPKSRAFMHLDTVFTQVDYGTFLTHSDINQDMNVFEIKRSPIGTHKLQVKPITKRLNLILSDYLQEPITLIPCGGQDVIASDREQWNDGANTLAIAPGKVIVYERNHITNEILKTHGIEVIAIPSSELSRGRGGPRCMSMPFYRESKAKGESK